MIISVASGKGGTGKTLVATSLALSLKDKYNVQLLDCDVEEPNDHIFLQPNITRSEAVSIPVPGIDEEKCTHCGICAEVCAYNAIAVLGEHVLTFPELCHGCGACSYLCPEKAISEVPHDIGVIETGHAGSIDFGHGKLSIGQAMAPPVIRKVKELADGSIYGAQEALDKELIDKVGYLDDAIDQVQKLAGIEDAKVVEYKKPFSLFDMLSTRTSGFVKIDRNKLLELNTPRLLYLWSLY